MSQTILYARVSTTEQNLDHQKTQAEASGFEIDDVVADHGVSGISSKLAERPEGRRLFDKLRRGDTLVVRWVDRLGRDYQDVTTTIREFMSKGVIIRTVINNMTFDGETKDPVQMAVRDALIGFMAATAQAQAEVMKEAQRAGIAAARGDTSRYRGKKPSYGKDQIELVLKMFSEGAGTSLVARETNLSRQTVLRIKDNPSAAQRSVERWSKKEGAPC